MKNNKLILDKYVATKYCIDVGKNVSRGLYDVWEYNFSVSFMHTKVFNKLWRVAKKEGYLKINRVEREYDERVENDDRWRYSLSGTINASSPFEHNQMVKDIEEIIK